MAFVSGNQTPFHAIRYSAFLGAMYLQSPEATAAIQEVKAVIGEDTVKKGFQGTSSSSASGKALTDLRAKGVRFGKMIGSLTGVRFIERESQGRKTPYLSVTVSDDEGKYNLSVAATQRGAQMLIRKLLNAMPGSQTELSIFATYGKREGADRAYAEHGSSVKQNGIEVQGINPRDALGPVIDAAMKALETAGVDDKETKFRRRSALELEYHLNLLKQVQAKFEQFYSDREQHMDDHAPVPSEDQPLGQPEEDDIPY